MYTKRQNATLNCWKLIAALLIMGHHAVEIGQSGDYVFHGAYVYTEFFFMMSGFFLVKSLEEGKVKSITEYSKKMWLKLFPYTSITITIYYVILGLLSGSVREFLRLWLKWPMELFYLSDLHIIGVQLGQLWYIAAILIIMPLFCWLYFKDKDLFKVLIWLLPLVWYGYCFTTWGQLGHRGVFIDLIRAVMNLGLGCFSFYISNKISKYEYSTKLKCLGMVIAWGSFIITIYFTYKFYWTEFDILCVFYFFISLIFATSGMFIDLKYNKSYFWAELSMSLYIVHISVGSLIQRFFGESFSVFQKYVLYYLLSIVCAIVLQKAVGLIKKYKCYYG